MAILPAPAAGAQAGRADRVPVVIYRLTRFGSMDFEMAAWQLAYLCLAPKRVYRNVYFHKQTKNTWARDDPAIFVLIAACIAVAGLGWSVAYVGEIGDAPFVALAMLFRDYLFVSVVAATLLQLLANTLLLAPPAHTAPADTRVEWAYAWDVHTNAFFPFFLALYGAQLVLLPVLLRDRWVCLWVGNTLYAAAYAQYIYGVYLGLNALPFLIRTELLLSPLLVLLPGYFVSLLGVNVAKGALSTYWWYTIGVPLR